jgi:hypothetical protein
VEKAKLATLDSSQPIYEPSTMKFSERQKPTTTRLKDVPVSRASNPRKSPLRAAIRAQKLRMNPPDLSKDQILGWADAYLERTGEWPNWQSGPIREAPGETWYTVAAALALGLRGLPHGASLDRLIKDERGRVNEAEPSFSVNQILGWVDAWQAETGCRPRKNSGSIPASGGLTWTAVDRALRTGGGVLQGGSSLSQLLSKERGVRRRPPVTERQILFWADAYCKRTGRWPRAMSGPIPESPGDTWWVLNSALKKGSRALPGGSTLDQLLIAHRGAGTRDRKRLRPPLAIPEILAWADAHQMRTGRWPCEKSGSIPEAPGTTWYGVQFALREGARGFPGGSSIALLLAEHRGMKRRGRKLKNRTVETGETGFANPVLYSS